MVTKFEITVLGVPTLQKTIPRVTRSCRDYPGLIKMQVFLCSEIDVAPARHVGSVKIGYQAIARAGSFTASGKSTPVHVLLVYCGLFQARDECDL